MTVTNKRKSPHALDERELARISAAALARVEKGREVVTLRIDDGEHVEEVDFPAGAVELLKHMLEEMALGRSVLVIPQHAELTTQQAADMLNVSRPYLVSLLERGEIPFHKVGSHRRICFEDLQGWMRRRDEERSRAMQELADLGQDMKLGY